MEDQPLGRLLRELPRERARDCFTARVLEGLEGPSRRPARRPGWILATAALLVLLVSAAAMELTARRSVWNGRPQAEAREERQALEEIRDEHERLARELERLQSLREGQTAEPEVIYLGGNESMDLVLDLGRMPEGTLPASYGSETF